ncbi:MAG: hypothetical protein J7K73_00635 [Nanoarchaeota archaeon]|nr:hypothetical protein [Nanoarchaeota archaeon]
MTHLVVYVPKADGKSIDDLFPEDVLDKIPTKNEIELIEEQNGYTLRTNMGDLPERDRLRIALANLDVHLGKLGITEYRLWVSVNVLQLNGVFYRASQGEDVNGKIESELDKVYNFGLQKNWT